MDSISASYGLSIDSISIWNSTVSSMRRARRSSLAASAAFATRKSNGSIGVVVVIIVCGLEDFSEKAARFVSTKALRRLSGGVRRSDSGAVLTYRVYANRNYWAAAGRKNHAVQNPY